MVPAEHSPAEQLSFLRSLALAGQDAPLSCGPYLVAAGIIFGVASLGHWGIANGLLASPGPSYMLGWIAAALAYTVFLVVQIRRDQGRAESAANRAINSVWSAAGFSMFVAWASLWIVSWRQGDYTWMAAIPIFILALYGAAWSVAGMLTRRRWVNNVALAAFAATLLVAWMLDSRHVMLVYALALFACAAVPGLYLMRRERTAG